MAEVHQPGRLRRRVYIVSPVTQGDRLHNLDVALCAFRRLLLAGHAPMAPQLSMLAAWVLPEVGYEDWMGQCLAWVAASEAVVRLAGHSPGGDREEALARGLGIPVYYGVDAFLAAARGEE